eukprot:11399136-Alexandrium_andersonii.AAC.1
MKERTVGAISLGPAHNVQGTYEFLNLVTWKVVRRNHWTRLPMPEHIIAVLNTKAAQDKKAVTARAQMMVMQGNDLPGTDNAEMVWLSEELHTQTLGQGTNGEVNNDIDLVENIDGRAKILEDLNEAAPFISMAGVDEGNPTAQDQGQDDQPLEVVPPQPPPTDEEGTDHRGGDQQEHDPPTTEDTGATAEAIQPVNEPVEDPPIIVQDAADLQPSETTSEVVTLGHGYNLRGNRERLSWRQRYANVLVNISTKKAIETLGSRAIVSIMTELNQMRRKQ